MLPVLFTVFGFPVQSYGVSKALAAFVAGLVLARAFRRHGLASDAAWSLVLWAMLWGFVGATLYYLAERAGSLIRHDFGGSGFTWYGGMIAGTIAVLILVGPEGAIRWRADCGGKPDYTMFLPTAKMLTDLTAERMP